MLNKILSWYKNKRILVTGGRGYIGTNLIKLLEQTNCQIVRLDKNPLRIKHKSIKAQIIDMTADISQSDVWEQALKDVDIIFHFAAQTSVHVANENPIEDHKINLMPMLLLLETCRQKRWHPIILFAGTVTETGIPTRLPVDESHPDNPITIYDLHKFMAENYLKYYADQGIVSGAILRLANVYGPGPKSSSADRGILNIMIQKALQGEDLTLYGKGNYLRDYIFIEDLVRAFLIAGTNIERLNSQHFVIGSGKGHKIKEAFTLVAERAKLKTCKQVDVASIKPPAPQSPIEARNFIADSKRFTNLTGWKPSSSLSEGIDRTIESYLEKLNSIKK